MRQCTTIVVLLNPSRSTRAPVQNPTKFTLMINLKTAAAPDITVPDTLLATADQVIE